MPVEAPEPEEPDPDQPPEPDPVVGDDADETPGVVPA